MFFLVLPEIDVEDRLMARMQQGDQGALRQVYSEYFAAVYQFVRPRVGSQQEAEDVVSEVFYKLVRAFQSHKLPGQSLRGWLFRVARNELNDRYQTYRDEQIIDIDESPPMIDQVDTEYEALRLVDIESMQKAIQRLTPDQQDVIILRYGQMLSLKETAELMGRNINAIKVLQYRAIQSLRRLLEQSEMRVCHD